MIGKVNAGGGGGIDLHVVGSATRPETPRNNTIWVETSSPITGWELGYKRPEAPAEGNVFIFANGATSVADMEISGLTGRAAKQIVKVTPSYAYQYISGAWENKAVKLYVNNGWLDTLTTLYDRGAYGAGFTHGWVPNGTEQSGFVQVESSTLSPVTSTSNGTVDLTGIKTVNIEWSGSATKNPDYDWGSNIELQIISANTQEVLFREQHYASYSTGLTTWSVNVSSVNKTVKFKLVATGGAGTGTITLYSIKLVPGNPT